MARNQAKGAKVSWPKSFRVLQSVADIEAICNCLAHYALRIANP